MASKKVIVHNKSDKPDNIVEKETEIFQECEKLENELPKFLRGFFVYLKGNVLPMTRLAYLHDLKFFFTYLINETGLTEADDIKDVKLSELDRVKAADVSGKIGAVLALIGSEIVGKVNSGLHFQYLQQFSEL